MSSKATSSSSYTQLLRGRVRALLTDPAYFWILSGLVIAGDAVLTQLIIRFVSCQKLFAFARTCIKFD